MREIYRRVIGLAWSLAVSLMLSAVLASVVFAQSSSADYPAPIFSNEVSGRIAPRDIGDARLTRHFYTFNGREGDLVFTVESSDLNGNVDVFTARGLRPLAQLTLYAGAAPTKISRSIYLQGDEPLVLRVEARTAGDGEGVYRVNFEGAFAPASGAQNVPPELMIAPTVSAETARREKGTRRVNSAGATIEEPPDETPPAATVADEATSERDNATKPKATTNAANAKPAPARRTPRPARNTARSTTPRPDTTTPADAAPEPATTTARNRRPTRRPATPRAARTRPAPASRDGATATNETEANAAATSAAPVAPAAVTATRLVIETKSGERIERDMKGVRRFSIENNQVVIVGQDGKVQRLPLAQVERMSVEP